MPPHGAIVSEKKVFVRDGTCMYVRDLRTMVMLYAPTENGCSEIGNLMFCNDLVYGFEMVVGAWFWWLVRRNINIVDLWEVVMWHGCRASLWVRSSFVVVISSLVALRWDRVRWRPWRGASSIGLCLGPHCGSTWDLYFWLNSRALFCVSS